MANKVIEKMQKGEKAYGIGLSYYADEIIELAGVMGLDFVNYDGQHAPITPETIDRFCRMCDGWGVTPTMRVPGCYFMPRGHRSYTSKRVQRFGLLDDLKKMMDDTNDDLLVMPQIEDIKAYNNLDEILQVDGINVFAGGPNDLAQSMGYPGEPDHPDCIKVTDEGTAKIHAAGKHRNEDVMVTIDATIALRDAVNEMLKSGDGIRGY